LTSARQPTSLFASQVLIRLNRLEIIVNVAFIGLGYMGLPMARNLAAAGHALTVYNRTAARADLIAGQARVARTPAGAVASADAVITMLADDHAVEGVVFDGGLLDSLPRGAVHISMSTISVALSQRLAEAHAARVQGYLAAPVFGRPEAAAEGKLFIVAAGAPDVVQKCEPLFEAMGQKTLAAGENPVFANVVKLTGNFLIACVIEGLGESVAVVRKYGMDPAMFMEILTSTLFAAPVYKTYGSLIVQEKYDPAGFRLQLGLKDVGLAQAAAEAVSAPMPFASVIHDKALAGIANGLADKDWSSLAHVSAQQAGLHRE
jgi:3-hydroxyisobutyrate dehydrogenase-like beta-hydroxyacid dehydrogenase